MRIWIVNPYGTIPNEGWSEYRSEMLARALTSRGHEVVWWISNFVHRSKKFRETGELKKLDLPINMKIFSVPSTAYEKNISIKRIIYERNFGENFRCFASKFPPPDAVIIADPAIFYGVQILKYVDSVKAKLIIDTIDLWPELFVLALPRPLRKFEKIIFSILYNMRRGLYRSAHGVVSVSEDYLESVLENNSETKNIVAYWGVDLDLYNDLLMSEESTEDASYTSEKLNVVYSGTLGDAYDMNLLLNAVKETARVKGNLFFYVAGDGPRKNDFIMAQKEYPDYIKFLGSVTPTNLVQIYRKCDVGIMSYLKSSTVAMPIKFYDYLAAGLAILNSLERDAYRFVEEKNLGLNYKSENVIDFISKLNYIEKNRAILREYKSNSKALSKIFDKNLQYSRYSNFVEKIAELP